jgi:hypothetical protein
MALENFKAFQLHRSISKRLQRWHNNLAFWRKKHGIPQIIQLSNAPV